MSSSMANCGWHLDPLEGKQFQVRKRNGNIIDFDETRIYLAIEALKADAELDQARRPTKPCRPTPNASRRRWWKKSQSRH